MSADNPSTPPPLPEAPSVQIPVSLQAVAYLSIIGGVLAAVDVLIGLTQQRVSLNFGVLGVPGGLGLLRLSRGWWRCEQATTALGLVFLAIGAIMWLNAPGPLTFNFLGVPVGYLPKWTGIVPIGTAAALLSWALWALSRPPVGEIFALGDVRRRGAQRAHPRRALLIVAGFIGIGLIETAWQYQFSRQYFVWVYANQPLMLGPQYELGHEWKSATNWHSSKHTDADIVDRGVFDLVVTASHAGHQVARLNWELEVALEANEHAVLYRMAGPAPAADADYAIRSTTAWDTHYADLTFAVVTPQFDQRSTNRVFWPNEDSRSGSASMSGMPLACPTLSATISWNITEASPPLRLVAPAVLNVQAGSVVNIGAPSGMFPGSTQPIAWTVTITPRDGKTPTEVISVDEGSSTGTTSKLAATARP